MTSNQKRINKEWKQCQQNPIQGINIKLDQQNLNIWHATIDGGQNTPYFGGRFHVKVQIPSDYPFRPPRIRFNTKIYHPWSQSKWSFMLLLQPNDQPMESSILNSKSFTALQRYSLIMANTFIRLMRHKPSHIELIQNQQIRVLQKAIQWTKQYASKQEISVGPQPQQFICSCCQKLLE